MSAARDEQGRVKGAEASAPELANDASSHAGAQPSVAIMPFDNLGEASDEYFADGVVEEITSALSRIRDFFVIARQSTFTFKGRFVDIREVLRELGVGRRHGAARWRSAELAKLKSEINR
jgi:TolB-like protein